MGSVNDNVRMSENERKWTMLIVKGFCICFHIRILGEEYFFACMLS